MTPTAKATLKAMGDGLRRAALNLELASRSLEALRKDAERVFRELIDDAEA